MTQELAQKNPDTVNPLNHLTQIFEEDMKQVNALILNRMQSDVPMIPQLAAYLIASGGKRIRPLLTLACTQIYNGDMNKAHLLAAAVEFIHTATLLHDDVVDESSERRGQDSANIVFGNQASVLVGDFLFSKSFELMVGTQNIDALDILSRASAVIAEGEVLQLSETGNININFETYTKIISAKTAALFSAACEVGPVIADQDTAQQGALRNYGTYLGIAFQIADDALDYAASQENLGKTIGDDFREGKLTAPILIALQDANAQEKEFWERTFKNHDQNENDLNTAQDILKRHNAIARSLDLAEDYGQKAKDALNVAPKSTIIDLLSALVDFSIHRYS